MTETLSQCRNNMRNTRSGSKTSKAMLKVQQVYAITACRGGKPCLPKDDPTRGETDVKVYSEEYKGEDGIQAKKIQ